MSTDLLALDALDETGRAALRRLILTLADSKRLMGLRYSDWLLGGPSIEAGIAVSSMAQDEWGHARLLYSMLKDLDEDPVAVEHDRPGEEYASVSALDEPMPDWAALVASMVVVDGGLNAVLESFAAGSYEGARNRVPKMLSEEEFHRSLGVAWFRRLAASVEARKLLHAAAMRLLPPMLSWVGVDDESARAMEAVGALGGAEQRLAAYRESLRELLALVDVDVDTVTARGEWDAARGRATGRPDEEAIVRARGDKNRALFVE